MGVTPGQGVLVQLELRELPLKSSEKLGASCTSPPELLVTTVPASWVPVALKSAALVCSRTFWLNTTSTQ